jgi:flagellin
MAGMDTLIAVVDKKRAELGAVQNRFQSTIRNQANISENLSAARSRIKDADFAAETAALTRSQIFAASKPKYFEPSEPTSSASIEPFRLIDS